MKFAVVEYNSKTGRVWKHREGHPNYLEDPVKTIDPTSFGSYVSALQGEHIPVTWLAKPNVARKAAKRLTGSWPPYSLDYLKDFELLLVVHQLSDAHEMVSFLKRLRKKFPHIAVLGVPTQPYGILKPHLEKNAKAKQDFIDFMNLCHAFITVVKDTQDWYESMAASPIVYVPQIYPTHYAQKYFLPRNQKGKTIFVAGVTDRPNIAQGFTVAKQLQKEFSDYMIHVTQIPGINMDFSELEGAKYDVEPFELWRQHLPNLAERMLVINTDYTLTRGRVQVDCAAVGTPSLGGNSDGSTDLYPELASTPDTSTDELIARGRRLLTDEQYYNHIANEALEKLKKYDFEESAARLLLLAKQYGKSK